MPAKPSTPARSPAGAPRAPASNGKGPKPEPKILFQKYFKSVGPRTYAAQVKEAGNGNHFLVLTEGKRDTETNEVKKLKLFIFGEDFPAYFRMLHETAQFIKAHPLSPEIKMRRMRYWAKKEADAVTAARMAAEAAAAKPARPVTPAKVTAKTTQRRPARGR